MGVEEELYSFYDLLDSNGRGYVVCEQLLDFHIALFFKPIARDQLEAALIQVCGNNSQGRCTKDQFIPLLLELERRKSIEERAWWDFKSLDTKDADRISVKDALFLFKATHEDMFSLHYWNEFMKSRHFSKDAVSFDEIRMWLCNFPSGEPSTYAIIFKECNDLENEWIKTEYKNHKEIKALQEDDFIQSLEAREKQQYQDKFRQGAKRKLNRWVQLGVEAVIFDDGLDVELNVRNQVTVQDLLEAMDEKYDILREKLLTEAVRRHIGDTVWSTMSESEREDQVLRVKTKEQDLRNQNELEKINQLSISYQNYSSRLVAMMGVVRQENMQLMQNIAEKTNMLKADGKTEEEINDILSSEHMRRIEGTSSCGKMLIELHKRHVAEHDFLVAILKGIQGRVLFSAEMISEYVLYVQQQLLANQEGEAFEYAAMATGLSERPQEFKSERFDADRDCHELLALERVHQSTARKPNRIKDDKYKPDINMQGIVDMQVEIMKMLITKHRQEREVLIYLVKGKESSTWQAVARRKSEDKREERLKDLKAQRNNWRQLNSQKRTERRTQHIKIMLEGISIYHETRKNEIKGGHNLQNNQVAAIVLADLQQCQAQEVEKTLLEMQHKTNRDLLVIWEREHLSWSEELWDNIAMTCGLGTLQLSQEEMEIAKALENKYELLRDKILIEMLVEENSLAIWWKMPDEQQQRYMMKKKLQERNLREDGRFEEVEDMFSSVVKNKENFYRLVGDLRIMKEKQVQEWLDKRRAQGKDSDDDDSDLEADEDPSSSSSLLTDIQRRYDEELDSIVALFQARGSKRITNKQRTELMLRLRLESMKVTQSWDFTESAITMGLTERGKVNQEKRLREDDKRYEKLAGRRMSNRQRGKEQLLSEYNEREENTVPPKEDIVGWQISVLLELTKRHRSERSQLMSILMDAGTDDLRDAAYRMSQEGREKRLMELKKNAEKLNLDDKGDREFNQDILEEAGAIKCVIRKQNLVISITVEVTQIDVSVSLLTDLQVEQDQECERMLKTMECMNQEQLSRLRIEQIWARQQKAGKNLLIIFTQYDGIADEDRLLRCLNKKYNCLKDKYLLDLLKKQMGDAVWVTLTEQQRQQRLIKLKIEEQRLRKEGKFDELSKLLGEHANTDIRLQKLMGESKSEYKAKLKRKLEERQRRQKLGLVIEGDDGLSEDEDDDSEPQDLLEGLQNRFEQERDALLARLRGAESQYMSERERQAELARLKREIRKAQREDDFSSAALVLGLAERNQAAKEERLKKDRGRQEDLARQRLEAARQKKRSLKTIQETVDETVINNGNRGSMQDAVIKALEQKHALERETFMIFLQREFSDEEKLVSENLSGEQRSERMQQIRLQIVGLKWIQTEERNEFVVESSLLKLVSKKIYLFKEEEFEATKADVIVSIMADLQEHQDKESEAVVKQLPDKDNAALVKLQQEFIQEAKYGVNKNLTQVVTTADVVQKTGDEELVEALEEKYDALRDKILTEALMKQMGAGEWAKLSEKERQARLMKLKIQERRLRQEGKYDEAAALLGDAAKSQAALAVLMGQTKKEQEAKMRERMERRRQRLAQGMSEAEVTKLEEEEIKQEEEEMKNQSKNVLQELDKRFNQEKAELLATINQSSENEKKEGVEQKYDNLRDQILADALIKQMGAGEWARLSERERQARMMKLKMQERKLRQEGKFDEAAALLGDAAKSAAALAILKEEARREQERRLRERIERRKQRMAQGMSEDEAQKLEEAEMKKDEEELKKRQENVLEAIENQESEDKEAVDEEEERKEVDGNYDNLRDKLLAEALMKQMGAGDWAKLSERERQAKMMQLRLKERKMRQEGKVDEAAALLGEAFKSQAAVSLLKEQARRDQERRLRERLEKRKQRIAQGMSEQEMENLEEEDLKKEEEEKAQETTNALVVIEKLRSQEKEFSEEVKGELVKEVEDRYDYLKDKLLAELLLKQLGAAEWALLSERERQRRLMLLKLRERQLRLEGRYDEANALLAALAKNQAALELMKEAARLEHERRLRERLLRKKQRISTGMSEDEAAKLEEEERMEDEREMTEKPDTLMLAIDRLMHEEKSELLEKYGKSQKEQIEKKYNDIRNELLAEVLIEQMSESVWTKLSAEEKQVRITQLRLEEHRLRRAGKFVEASVILAAVNKSQKALDVLIDASKKREETRLRTRLELRRKREIAGMNEEEILNLEEQDSKREEEQTRGRPQNPLEAIELLLDEDKADALNKLKKPSDEEVMQDTQEKYDALRDQILTEALMKQMGAGEWAKLSEKERQSELLKLKMREKKLRQEGKYDEAAALLGDAVKSEAAMRMLREDARSIQQRRIFEMLEKRRQRLEAGMSESEVEKLEGEEREQEEAEKERTRPKNVLEALDHKLDEEKAALMASLSRQNERLENERKRQLALTKLRREQRKARHEDNFDAAALVLGLAQKGEDAHERDRKRQEQLAKERLEQRRKQRAAAKDKSQGTAVVAAVPLPQDENDSGAMQEVVVMEMEMRFERERSLLMELIQGEEESERRDRAKAMSEETRQKKLSELREQRQQWRDSGPTKEDEKEHVDILQKATAITLESKLDIIRGTEIQNVTEENVQVSLLADLQQKQDEESQYLMEDLGTKTITTLKQLKQVQFLSRSNGWNDNVAASVLRTTAEDKISNEQLVKALEGKYDALKDKLIIQTLIAQFGAAKWSSMSEKEVQMQVMKIKLQEKRLRQEGKIEEANVLLTKGVTNQQELAVMLGDTNSQEKEKMRRKMEIKEQMRAQMEAQGLTVIEESLEESAAAEEARMEALDEKKNKRRNILDDLNNHFEEEKAALLAALQGQDERYMNERKRQLALAKLRREQRKLKEEDKFDASVVLFGLSQQHEKAREKSVMKDQERQKELARERLAAARAKRAQQKQAGDDELQMSESQMLERMKQDEIENQQLDASQANEGVVGLHIVILDEIEKKHSWERDILYQLIEKAETFQEIREKAKNMSSKDLWSELESLRSRHDNWKFETMHEIGYDSEQSLTGDAMEIYLQKLISRKEEQRSIITRALVFRQEVIRRRMVAQGVVSETTQVEEEIPVALLADLQQKQTLENNALTTVLTNSEDKGDEFLIQLKETHRRARREGWLENLSVTIFNQSAWEELEEQTSHEEQKKLALLDAEMEKQKEEINENRKKKGTDFDADAAMAQLQQQYAAKRKVMMEELERQRKQALKKLEARKLKQEEKEYEDLAVFAMLQNAEKQKALIEKSAEEQKAKHSSLMQERLAARREQRKLEAEKQASDEKQRDEEQARQEEEAKRLKEAGKGDTASVASNSVPSSATSQRTQPPFGGMKREKTVVDVDLSESQKKALFTALVRDHTRAQLKMEKEHERHSEALRKRIEDRKNRYTNTAMNIIGIGERQKTKLEMTKKEEREKQLTMVRERIEKVKYERTQTNIRRVKREKEAFKNILDEEEAKNMTEDEQMSKAAALMQENFIKAQAEYKDGGRPAIMDDDLSSVSSGSKPSTPVAPIRPKSSRLISQKERERLLKEKRMQKKRGRGGVASSAAAAPDMDSLAKMLETRRTESELAGQ